MPPRVPTAARSTAGASARRGPEQNISLYVDIGQGAGLAAATGIRPFLPALLAGAMARGDVLIDFDGSGWQFLESPAFLLALFAFAVLRFGAERSDIDRRMLERGTLVLGVALGALLFAGSLAAGDASPWPGLAAGAICALLGRAALGGLFERAARRVDDGAGLLSAYAEGAALLVALIAILAPPLAFLALAAFLLLLVKAGQAEDRKYAGLRSLR